MIKEALVYNFQTDTLTSRSVVHGHHSVTTPTAHKPDDSQDSSNATSHLVHLLACFFMHAYLFLRPSVHVDTCSRRFTFWTLNNRIQEMTLKQNVGG